MATVKPELLNEWDYKKNKVTPQHIMYRTNRKVWWICEKGHSYEASLLSRYSGSGCPICSNKQVLAGYNDLATIKPDMLEKWNYEKNVIMPKEITYGSKRKVWWKCPECSYQWKAAVYTITGKRMGGCPRCAREARTSFPEQAAYFYIKQLFPSAINGDRVQIYPKELDIYIPEINVAIEYDGEAFHQSRKRDIEKNMLCQERGIFLYRIREMKCPPLDDVDNCVSYNYDRYDISSLAEVIKRICNRLGKDIDIDLERDELSIEEQYRKKKKENNLAGLYPELVKEWDYVKNKGLSPDKYSFGSSQKVWWICSKGHSYSCAINLRSVGNAGCPYCANKKVLQGYNDLLSRYPEISDEWCYEKNKERPENVVSGSHKKVWWKCKKCSGSWEATIVNRTKGTGCPSCKIQRTKNTRNKNELEKKRSVAEKYPLLAKEWDYENNNISPEIVAASGDIKFWWICSSCGHRWNARLYNRMKGHGCPRCARRKGRKINKKYSEGLL